MGSPVINQKLDAQSGYYSLFRSELTPFFEGFDGSVLDVGCGSGELLKYLKKQGARRTIGLEMRSDVADALRQSETVDEVLSLDIEAEDLPVPPESLDAIVVSHVLEHMVNPWRVLRKLHRCLKSDGILIGALPNVRHISVVGNLLLRGRWQYTESGILDVTHLRFFTRHSAAVLLQSSGFAVEVLKPEISGPRASFISAVSLGSLNDLVTYAYNFRCRKVDPAPGSAPM
jgi:SAM-dependent methyltransferase